MAWRLNKTVVRGEIESTDYRITVSEPVWTMDEEQENEQRIANGHAIMAWMEHLTDFGQTLPRSRALLLQASNGHLNISTR